VQVAVADNGFSVQMPLNRKVDIAGIIRDLDPGDVTADLRAAIDGTDLLQRYFRINATRSLMILKRYKGHEKSAAQQQVSSEMLLSFAQDLDSFAVIEETYREIMEDKLNIAGVREVLERVDRGEIEIVAHEVDSPSPRAFGLATLMASDVVLPRTKVRSYRSSTSACWNRLMRNRRRPPIPSKPSKKLIVSRQADGGLLIAGVTEVGPAGSRGAGAGRLACVVGRAVGVGVAERVVRMGRRPRGRFVVLPAGGEWYPTDSAAGIEPMSVGVVDGDASAGTYAHPELPYEITVLEG